MKKYKLSNKDLKSIKSNHSHRVLLISHEMSQTGAPRALVYMALVMRKRGIEPVFLSDQYGPLAKEISDLDFKVVIEPLMNYVLSDKKSLLYLYVSQFDTIVFNTIVCSPLIIKMDSIPVKKVLWLHEGSMSYEHYDVAYDLNIIYNRFDYIYCVGDYSKSFAEKYVDGKNLGILYYGIPDLAKGLQKIKKEEPIKFIIAGTICKRKAQDLLIKSLFLVSENIRERIEINVVGEPIGSRIVEEVKDSPFSCVKYLGPMEHDELMKLYLDMDYILCPSLDDPMPIVCTEGMMFSKVVMVSEATGTASLIKNGETGYRFPAGDEKALAKAIESAVLDYSDKYHEMGMRSRVIFEENFAMAKFEDSVYRKIIEVPKRDIPNMPAKRSLLSEKEEFRIVKNAIKNSRLTRKEAYYILKLYLAEHRYKSHKIVMKYIWYRWIKKV